MIEAKDLRIGNLVASDKENAPTPFTINRKIMQYLCKNCDWDLLEPIPLTEEWLLKFGFERWKDCKRWSLKHILIYSNSTDLFYFGKARNRICIKYVNQLQNLYFALTGEELKYEI